MRNEIASIDSYTAQNAGLLIKVLIVDDNDLWRQTISGILRAHAAFEIVGVASSRSAIQFATASRPAVVLLDIELRESSGIDLGEQIHALSPNTKIVFVSAHTDVDIVRTAIRVGQSSYVLKSDVGAELLSAIHAAMRGENFLSRGVAHCRPPERS